jgi:hypothetical protein
MGLAIRWWLMIVVTVIAIMLIGTFGFGWFQKSTADYRGGVRETEKVHADPNYRITHYDQFFNQCASIQTLTAQAQNAKADFDSALDPVSKRDARLRMIALRNQKISAINQYNADSAKEDTEANFKSSDLPYRIDQNAEVVTCAA